VNRGKPEKKTKMFSKEFLQNTVYGDTDAEVIEDKIIDQHRWSLARPG
jgi:hypothetical protein